MNNTQSKSLNMNEYFYDQAWAIQPEKLQALARLVGDRSGVQVSIDAMSFSGESGRINTTGTAAVIPVIGTLVQRAGLFESFLGGVSVDRLSAQFDDAVRDDRVNAIVFDIDSPGGSVNGIPEFADRIRAARGKKPIIAVANSLMASAAFWIGAQADEIVASPSSDIGSVGVVAMHVNQQKFMEDMGIEVTFIHHGDHKIEGNTFEPIADEAKAFVQKRVDEFGAMFEQSLARGRGVSVGEVRSNFGSGRVFGAKEAVSRGMADRVGTLQDELQRLSSRNAAKAKMSMRMRRASL